MQVAIVGFGRFGRALGSLVDAVGQTFQAWDPYADIPEMWRASSLEALITGADCVVVAVPVATLPKALAEIAPYVSASQFVMDVGSVKVHPVEALREAFGDRVPWVGTHPLFGPLSLALAERPMRVIVCPNPSQPDSAPRARAFYERLGCEVFEQDARDHDRLMARTHALTFFVAKGMIDAGVGADVPFAPASFQGILRTIDAVRSDAGHLFRTIQLENPYSAEARRDLLAALRKVDQALNHAHPEGAGGAEQKDEGLTIPDLGARSPERREIRTHISAIDHEIAALLARRSELSARAVHPSIPPGSPRNNPSSIPPSFEPSRDAELKNERRVWAAELGLDGDALDDVFLAIARLSGPRRT